MESNYSQDTSQDSAFGLEEESWTPKIPTADDQKFTQLNRIIFLDLVLEGRDHGDGSV